MNLENRTEKYTSIGEAISNKVINDIEKYTRKISENDLFILIQES